MTSESAAETEAIGARLAADLRPGDVVLVLGDVGTGKTTLIRGACRALGITEPVVSPTFTIGRRYRGRVPVSHLDLYRLADIEGEEPALLDDYLDPDTITFVEWPAVAEPRLAARTRLEVHLAHEGGDRRTIEVGERIHPQIAVFREQAGRVASPDSRKSSEEEEARPMKRAKTLAAILMGVALLASLAPAMAQAAAFRHYVACGLSENAKPAHLCQKKRDKGAFFRSIKSDVFYTVCVKFPTKRQLCAPKQEAKAGTLYVNKITSNIPGKHKVTWFVEGKKVGEFDFTVKG